jgi:streptomycin 6-kinase
LIFRTEYALKRWRPGRPCGSTICRLIDPEGAIGEPEYDLGILMREDPEDLMAGDPRDRCRWLAQRTGRDETAIWEWGVVERMSTGLLCTQIGVQPQGRLMLAAADALTG